MWMLQLLTTGSWLLKTTVCHQSELKGKTWVTVLACVWRNKLVTDINDVINLNKIANTHLLVHIAFHQFDATTEKNKENQSWA